MHGSVYCGRSDRELIITLEDIKHVVCILVTFWLHYGYRFVTITFWLLLCASVAGLPADSQHDNCIKASVKLLHGGLAPERYSYRYFLVSRHTIRS